jgi:hypothetical protein
MVNVSQSPLGVPDSDRFPERRGVHDRAMIQLDDIVEVATASHHHVLPLRVLPSQTPQRSMTRHVAIERYLARPP